jgi:hypothetical protein
MIACAGGDCLHQSICCYLNGCTSQLTTGSSEPVVPPRNERRMYPYYGFPSLLRLSKRTTDTASKLTERLNRYPQLQHLWSTSRLGRLHMRPLKWKCVAGMITACISPAEIAESGADGQSYHLRHICQKAAFAGVNNDELN